MSDRVDNFVDEFEAVIRAHRQFAKDAGSIAVARREAVQLAATLDRLALSNGAPRSVTSADLRALHDELDSMGPPPIQPLLSNARALLQLIDDGIIDGDAAQVRRLLGEAEGLSSARQRTRSSAQTHLEVPAKAMCRDCDDLLVGRRQAALNWNAITKAIRDHERDVHGGYTEELRDELSDGLRGLRAGESVVTSGRYQIGQL